MSTGVSPEDFEGGVKELSCFTAEVEVASTFTAATSFLVSVSSPHGLKIPPCCPTAFRPPRAMLGDITHLDSHPLSVIYRRAKGQNIRAQPFPAPKSDCAQSPRPHAPSESAPLPPPILSAEPPLGGDGPRASNRGAQPSTPSVPSVPLYTHCALCAL